MERQGRINTSLPNLEHMITKMKMCQTLHSQKIFLFVLQVVCSQSWDEGSCGNASYMDRCFLCHPMSGATACMWLPRAHGRWDLLRGEQVKGTLPLWMNLWRYRGCGLVTVRKDFIWKQTSPPLAFQPSSLVGCSIKAPSPCQLQALTFLSFGNHEPNTSPSFINYSGIPA